MHSDYRLWGIVKCYLPSAGIPYVGYWGANIPTCSTLFVHFQPQNYFVDHVTVLSPLSLFIEGSICVMVYCPQQSAIKWC